MSRVDNDMPMLREAVQVGLADLVAGRFTDVRPNAIDAFIAKLGAEADKRHNSSRHKKHGRPKE